jgi:hypothetical protein
MCPHDPSWLGKAASLRATSKRTCAISAPRLRTWAVRPFRDWKPNQYSTSWSDLLTNKASTKPRCGCQPLDGKTSVKLVLLDAGTRSGALSSNLHFVLIDREH